VEVAGFRSNTAPKLIDVADYFIDLGEIADRVRKEMHGPRYDEREMHEQQPTQYLHDHLEIPEPVAEEFPASMRVVVVETTIESDADEMNTAELVRILDEH
jgi:hypothetical protein